ncbi:MAG: GxxExxY protein [Lentisphaeria bacterium]|nr:GxxExxY protein [Lentisphaeria bacterium]
MVEKNMFKQEGYELIGAAFEVYNEMGHGFLEEVYQECYELELNSRKIPFETQPELPVYYKKSKIGKFYRPDLYLFSGIVVELKAVKQLTDEHRAQLLNYLKASRKQVGYLINFGNAEKLEWERYITNQQDSFNH